MKKYIKLGLALLILYIFPYLVSCKPSVLNYDDIPNIKTCLTGEGVELSRIELSKGNENYRYIKNSFQNEMIPVYKYKLIDRNKYIYSYDDKNRFTYDYEKNAYNVYGLVDGVFTSYLCSYIGQIGYLESKCSMKLYNDSNLLEIIIESNKNVTLKESDYKALIDSNIDQKVQEKDQLKFVLNEKNNDEFSLFGKYSFYIDLNYFDNYEYRTEDDKLISDNVKKINRRGSFSSTYVSCYDSFGVTYILGGKNNEISISNYTNGKNDVYLPIASYIDTVSINNETYEYDSEIGDVLLQVDPYIDYDKDICGHYETNYRNQNLPEDDYSLFINQNIINYSIDGQKFYINTKKPTLYIENIKEYGFYVFINVEEY